MNSVLLSKNKYTAIGFGQTDKHSEQQYRLFINRVKLKQKNYTNALVMFVNLYNTFITEKYPDEKDLWLIVNNNQTTNYDVLDAKDKIYDYTSVIKELENRIMNIEKQLCPVIGRNVVSYLMSLTKDQYRYNTSLSNYRWVPYKNYNGTLNWSLSSFISKLQSLLYANSINIQFKINFSSEILPTYWDNFDDSSLAGDRTFYAKSGKSTLTIDLISI